MVVVVFLLPSIAVVVLRRTLIRPLCAYAAIFPPVVLSCAGTNMVAVQPNEVLFEIGMSPAADCVHTSSYASMGRYEPPALALQVDPLSAVIMYPGNT